MSDKVSTSLAAQLHSHALASAEGSGGVGGVSACHASTDKDIHAPPLQFEMDAPAAAISAQLNFKIVPADSLPGLSYQDMFASMNTSQISNASTESSCVLKLHDLGTNFLFSEVPAINTVHLCMPESIIV